VGIKVAVIGTGNILLRDEGIGVHIIRTIGERYRFPDNVRLIDAGTMGIDLLPFIEDSERLLIIDAVDLKKPAGTIELINGKDLPAILNSKISVHQIGLSDLLFAIRFRELPLKEICLIGIQPDSIGTGTELSDVIKEQVDTLIEHTISLLREWGIEVFSKEG